MVAATTAQHQPFSMRYGQGTPVHSAASKQMIQADPVQLEGTGQQNLAGIDEDVDLPPFLRR